MQSEIYSKHSRHFVAVDCSIFGYDDGVLKLLLYPRGFEPEKGKWSLMGGFVEENESADDAARRILFQTTGIQDIILRSASVFSAPDRDPGARVISVSYVALIRISSYDEELGKAKGAQWWPVTNLPSLIFDHKAMIEDALQVLQQRALVEPIGFELLPEMFTMAQLRNLYDAIFQKTFDPGNFRKKVLSLSIVKQLNLKDNSTSRKGAYYYRFITSNIQKLSGRVLNFLALLFINGEWILSHAV